MGKQKIFLFVMLAALFAPSVFFANPASAAGERYFWQHKGEISGAEGNYKQQVPFRPAQPVTPGQPIPNYNSAGIITDKSGCVFNAHITFGGSSDPANGRLVIEVDPATLLTGSGCSEAVTNSYTKNFAIANPEKYDDEDVSTPDVKKIKVSSQVPKGSAYPGSSDTITLKQGDAVIATKEATTPNGDSEAPGYNVEFTNVAPGQYTVCSANFDNKCVNFNKSANPLVQLVQITGDPEGDPGCQTGSALGWVICPLIGILSDTTKTLAEQVQKLLKVTPVPLNPSDPANSENRAVYDIWSSVRNIANVVLVFGFFAIVFSQATSVGLSSYGIKKLLPRLIVVALAINLSYFACALLIDIFNVLGAGVQGFFNVAELAVPGKDASTGAVDIGAAVGVYIAAVAAAFFFWPMLLTVLAIAATAFITAFAVLAFRQVALIMLIIVAPLAFAAWLLPNTEGYFTKWRKLFTGLLLMYPLVMFIIYGSILASSIIRATGGPGETDVIHNLMSLIVLAVPLFSLPFLLKFAGGIGERIGAISNNRQKGIIDRARKKSDEIRGNSAYQRGKSIRKQQRDAFKTTKFAQDLDPQNGNAFRRRVAGGIPLTKAGRDASQELARIAQETRRKDFTDRVGRRHAEFESGGLFNHENKAYDAKTGQELRMHERLAALASGHSVFYQDSEGKRHDIDPAKDSYSKYAAMKQIADSADGKAISEAHTGAIVNPDQASKYTIKKGSADEKEFLSYLGGSSGVAAKFPHIRKSDDGAFGKPSAGQVASYFKDEAILNIKYAQRQNDNGASMGRLREAFINSMLNDDSYRDMATDTRTVLEEHFNLKGVDIREQAGKPVFGTSKTQGDSEKKTDTPELIIPQGSVERRAQPAPPPEPGTVVINRSSDSGAPSPTDIPQSPYAPPPAPQSPQDRRRDGGNFGGFS